LLILATTLQGGFALRNWAPLALFALILIAAVQVAGGGLSVVNRWVGVAVAAIWAYAVWVTLSALWAESAADALESAGRTLLYASLVTIGLLLTAGERARRWLGWVLVGGICVIAIITVGAMLASDSSVFLAGRLNAPVEYRNATACLFAVVFWPLIGQASTREAGRVGRSAAFALATLSLALAFITQSRGILLGLAIGGIVMMVAGPDRVRRAWLAIVSVAGVAAFSPGLLTAYHAFDGGRGVVASGDIHSVGITLVLLTTAAFVVGVFVALLDRGLRAASPGMRLVRRGARVCLAVVAVVAVAGTLVAIGNPVAYARQKWDDFTSLKTTTPSSTRLTSTGGQRYDIWRIALDDFVDHPIAGVGAGNYSFSYYRHRHTDRNLSDPHGIPFQLLGDTGIVGFALFAAFLVAMGGALVRGWRTTYSPMVRRSAAGLAAAAAVVFGQAMVDWIWLIPGVMGLGFFCLALAVAQVSRAGDDEAGRAGPAPGWVRTVTTGGLVVGIALVLTLFLSDLYVRKAEADKAADAPIAQLSAAQDAGRFNPWSVTPHYLQAGALESLGRRAAAQQQLLDALRLEPTNVATLGLLGDFELRAGDRAAARRYYGRASALDPRDVGLKRLARLQIGR
jgi:hypothetical protein